MAAKHSEKEPSIYFPFKLTPMEEAALFMQFDMNCEFDIQEIKTLKEEKKHLKKVCVYKLLLFPIESFFTLLLFGMLEFKCKLKMTSLYYKFFRNKITLEKFGKELTLLFQTGKAI